MRDCHTHAWDWLQTPQGPTWKTQLKSTLFRNYLEALACASHLTVCLDCLPQPAISSPHSHIQPPLQFAHPASISGLSPMAVFPGTEEVFMRPCRCTHKGRGATQTPAFTSLQLCAHTSPNHRGGGAAASGRALRVCRQSVYPGSTAVGGPMTVRGRKETILSRTLPQRTQKHK